MPLTTVRTPPSVEDYIPLSVYEASTPESFVGGKPVLHFDLRNVRAAIPRSQCRSLSMFPADSPTAVPQPEDGVVGPELIEQRVNVFVSSAHLAIFSPEAEAGHQIPYPSIAIHAVKQVGSHQAIWMQLEFSDGGADDDDFANVELTITPPVVEEADPSLSFQLYEAIAKCSNLHPDPVGPNDDDEDEDDRIIFEGDDHEPLEGFSGVLRGSADGGLPPPMPGSGGWITADNVHEHFDENGNWRGAVDDDEEEPEELGEGAGRTRARDELEGEAVNGLPTDDDPENKRPRVE